MEFCSKKKKRETVFQINKESSATELTLDSIKDTAVKII